MSFKDIVREIKAIPNGKALWKIEFNKIYAEKGFPFGDAFNECVRRAILNVAPHLIPVMPQKLNGNTANAVASKLDS